VLDRTRHALRANPPRHGRRARPFRSPLQPHRRGDSRPRRQQDLNTTSLTPSWSSGTP